MEEECERPRFEKKMFAGTKAGFAKRRSSFGNDIMQEYGEAKKKARMAFEEI